jgi:GntR family transcriptional regulator, transcriptional repressor for pyruvate dehydrogenase complex
MSASAGISFGPIRSTRLFEEICEQIRGQLSLGKIGPGDKLPAERDLAEQFGVSRAALREALRTLEVSGLIELRKGAKGGAFMLEAGAPMTQSFESMLDLGRIPMRDFTEARILLTEVVVRLACERGTKADFAAIERDIDRVEAAVARREGYKNLNVITEFYDLLAAATGNQMLRFLTHGIAQVLSGLIQARQPSPTEDLVERRREILKSLRARDADTAGKLLSRHLMRVHARMNGPVRARVPQTGVSALYEKRILHSDSDHA